IPLVVQRRAGKGNEPFHIRAEIRPRRIDHRIGPVGGNDTPVPARLSDDVVGREVIRRRIGRRDHLDAELLVECARAHRGIAELVGNTVIEQVGIAFVQSLRDAENRFHGMLEPQARRRAAKQVPVFG
ncbi:hypothetical protein QU38_00175, partial [Staphylococcus aureus]